MVARHDWNTWDQYLSAHDRRLRDFEHFILTDTCRYAISESTVVWGGVLRCRDGIEIHI